MKLKIKIAILKALLKCDGQPMPESALYAAAQMGCRPSDPTRSDFEVGLRETADEGYCEGVTDDFLQERSWTLTTKGMHKARSLK